MKDLSTTASTGKNGEPYDNAEACRAFCILVLVAAAVTWVWCVFIPKEDMRSYCEWQNMTKAECKSYWYHRNPYTYWLREQ